MIASGLLLVGLGLWLLFQTLAGDLPQRIVSWASGNAGGSSSSGGDFGSGGGDFGGGDVA
jgi:hypothetical protein